MGRFCDGISALPVLNEKMRVLTRIFLSVERNAHDTAHFMVID
jgi:hypothetical protein